MTRDEVLQLVQRRGKLPQNGSDHTRVTFLALCRQTAIAAQTADCRAIIGAKIRQSWDCCGNRSFPKTGNFSEFFTEGWRDFQWTKN